MNRRRKRKKEEEKGKWEEKKKKKKKHSVSQRDGTLKTPLNWPEGYEF